VAGVLLVGAGGLAAMGPAVLVWPETRRELFNTVRSLPLFWRRQSRATGMVRPRP